MSKKMQIVMVVQALVIFASIVFAFFKHTEAESERLLKEGYSAEITKVKAMADANAAEAMKQAKVAMAMAEKCKELEEKLAKCK